MLCQTQYMYEEDKSVNKLMMLYLLWHIFNCTNYGTCLSELQKSVGRGINCAPTPPSGILWTCPMDGSKAQMLHYYGLASIDLPTAERSVWLAGRN